MKNTKHTIIDVQKKYIANLEKQVADLEKTLENTITPDETTKKLFNLLDQLMFVAIGKNQVVNTPTLVVLCCGKLPLFAVKWPIFGPFFWLQKYPINISH